MWNYIKSEPAVVIALIGAALTVAVAFGVSLSDAQLGAISAFVTVLVGFVTRSQVTPAVPAEKPAAPEAGV